MHTLKVRGIFFVAAMAFIAPAGVSAEEGTFLDLGPIVVSKAKIHLAHSYSLINGVSWPEHASLSEALAAFPLDLQSRSPKGDIQTDFSLRGSTFQGVLILVDGQRINDPQTAHHNSDIPLTKEDIERIEVIPGAGSSLFGPDAIGGAINIVTKKPTRNRAVFEVRGGRYQSDGQLFSISGKKDALGGRFSLERQESDGFRYDTGFRKVTASGSVSLDIPEGAFTLESGYQAKEFGAFDFYTPGKGFPSKERTETYLLNTGFSVTRGDILIKPNFLWRSHFDTFLLDESGLKSSLRNRHRSDVYTPGIYFKKEAGFLGSVGCGLEYGDEHISSSNLGNHARSHRSVFLDESKDATGRLSLGLSARFDDYDGFNRMCTGSLNAKYALTKDAGLVLGIQRSIRVPSFTELYYNDPTTSGDPGLSAEKALTYQLGFERKEKKLAYGLTFFLRREDDFIDWVKLDATQAQWTVRNITEADVYGIENYLKWDISRRIRLDSNYTYINRKIYGQGYSYKYGPSATPHLVNTSLCFDLPAGVQRIWLTYKKKPRRRGWLLVNASFIYNLPLKHAGDKKAELFCQVTNILNAEYQDIEGIPEPGRWVEGGLRFEW